MSMKRSEFFSRLKERCPEVSMLILAADLAEEAGVEWDLEELERVEEAEPPRRVYVRDGIIVAEGRDPDETDLDEDDVNARRAAAAYNAVARYLDGRPFGAPTLRRILFQEREKLRRSHE